MRRGLIIGKKIVKQLPQLLTTLFIYFFGAEYFIFSFQTLIVLDCSASDFVIGCHINPLPAVAQVEHNIVRSPDLLLRTEILSINTEENAKVSRRSSV